MFGRVTDPWCCALVTTSVQLAGVFFSLFWICKPAWIMVIVVCNVSFKPRLQAIFQKFHCELYEIGFFWVQWRYLGDICDYSFTTLQLEENAYCQCTCISFTGSCQCQWFYLKLSGNGTIGWNNEWRLMEMTLGGKYASKSSVINTTHLTEGFPSALQYPWTPKISF